MQNNRAWLGGAIFVGEAIRLEFQDSLFERNRAVRSGGAVFITGDRKVKSKNNSWGSLGSKHKKSAVVIINWTRFEHNEAHTGGEVQHMRLGLAWRSCRLCAFAQYGGEALTAQIGRAHV